VRAYPTALTPALSIGRALGLTFGLGAASWLAGGAPAAAQAGLPPELAAFAAERSAECAALGGAPRVGPAFATAVDLTGDGALDYIVDLAGIECANAWSAFCGSAGCPVSVWIAGPGGHGREWADYAQAWSIDGAGDAVAVVVERHGSACPDAASGAETCRERLTFAGAAGPAAPAAPAAADAGSPDAEATPPAGTAAAASAAAPAAALEAPGVEGWTLREAPGGSPVAVSDGPGGLASIAVFCLGGQPFLAAVPREPAEGAEVELGFAFSRESVSAAARREESAGGALVVDLAGSPLAGLLSGRDTSARVSLAGAEQGTLSLRGSTRAIRAALSGCAP